ncbi:MAG: hypothetical protein IKQ22_03840 [Clostridia bacterium]|nr:hypothetical protein [Clostridia bacterium]
MRKSSRIVLVAAVILIILSGCSKAARYDTGTFSIRLAEDWFPKENRSAEDLYGGEILKLEKRSASPLGEGISAYYPLMIIERHDKGYVKQKDTIHHYRSDGIVKIKDTEYVIQRADYLGFVYQYISYDKGNNTFIILISVTLEGKIIDLSFEDKDIQKMILSLK